MSEMSGEKKSFEEMFEELRGIVKTLESGKLSLEDSIEQFEKAMKLSQACQEVLSQSEQKVEELMKVSENPVWKPLEKSQDALQSRERSK